MKPRQFQSAPTKPRCGRRHAIRRQSHPLGHRAVVAAILAYWSGSPIRHDFSTFVMVVAVLMVAAMWVFPEAGVKKGDAKRAK